ncbi:hypothetical protein B0I37DRAFT_53942 [Chaetomium sp. MPI-CAGE-AT-0009]|nr:hypothetical protein B0I37DRAFT_53942 [Chaetomium sp. MPI-CAGE-AT-0009]
MSGTLPCWPHFLTGVCAALTLNENGTLSPTSLHIPRGKAQRLRCRLPPTAISGFVVVEQEALGAPTNVVRDSYGSDRRIIRPFLSRMR